MQSARDFYAQSRLALPHTRADVLSGRVIRINPALITLVDGRIRTTGAAELQQMVLAQADALLELGLQTLHVDINFPDYGGFGDPRPDMTDAIFTPEWVTELTRRAVQHGAYVNIHLLTDHLSLQLRNYADSGAGAVCFQLDSVPDGGALVELIDQIHAMGAAASPVIETVGTAERPAEPPETIAARLRPLLWQIDMLTLQAAMTASRSNQAGVMLDTARAEAYLKPLRPYFTGTLQIQGGITKETIKQAVKLGADFLVAGTQIFRSGANPGDVIAQMLAAAAAELGV